VVEEVVNRTPALVITPIVVALVEEVEVLIPLHLALEVME
tara:strand:- start:383 stop:502 length:120 start_codon:yes stop_codon:yes gene_type:complete